MAIATMSSAWRTCPQDSTSSASPTTSTGRWRRGDSWWCGRPSLTRPRTADLSQGERLGEDIGEVIEPYVGRLMRYVLFVMLADAGIHRAATWSPAFARVTAVLLCRPTRVR